MKMGHLQNNQSLETSIETGNLQSYDEQSVEITLQPSKKKKKIIEITNITVS